LTFKSPPQITGFLHNSRRTNFFKNEAKVKKLTEIDSIFIALILIQIPGKYYIILKFLSRNGYKIFEVFVDNLGKKLDFSLKINKQMIFTLILWVLQKCFVIVIGLYTTRYGGYFHVFTSIQFIHTFLIFGIGSSINIFVSLFSAQLLVDICDRIKNDQGNILMNNILKSSMLT